MVFYGLLNLSEICSCIIVISHLCCCSFQQFLKMALLFHQMSSFKVKEIPLIDEDNLHGHSENVQFLRPAHPLPKCNGRRNTVAPLFALKTANLNSKSSRTNKQTNI